MPGFFILLDKFNLNKGEKLPDVERKIQQVCTLLGINPAWLMMVMWSESRLNAQSVNKQPGDSDNPQIRAATRATGLIQFMPDTALNLGTTTKAIYAMNAIDQLGYVYKYFKPWTGKIKSYFDLYLVTFSRMPLENQMITSCKPRNFQQQPLLNRTPFLM